MTRSRPPTQSRCSSPTCVASWRPTATHASCTRSGEPATSSALRSILQFRLPLPAPLQRAIERVSASFDRLPIRIRLAGVSALLTFVILCGFAVAIGSLTVHRIRSDFNGQVAETASQLPSQLSIKINPSKVNPSTFQIVGIDPPLQDLAEPEGSAVIRILSLGG